MRAAFGCFIACMLFVSLLLFEGVGAPALLLEALELTEPVLVRFALDFFAPPFACFPLPEDPWGCLFP